MLLAYDESQTNKNIYYLAISGTQKCIRRGDIEGAVNLAKVAWKHNPEGLWKRLWTILGEDCGRDLKTLRVFYDYSGSFKEFYDLMPLVVAMATGSHDRQTVAVTDILVHQKMCLSLSDEDATVLNTIRTDFREMGLEVYSPLKFITVLGTECRWPLELSMRAKKYDREQFCSAIPYFYLQACHQAPILVLDECEGCHKYKDFFPLEASDVHTRPGQAAYKMYLEHRKFEFTADLKIFGEYVFLYEGGLLRKYSPYKVNFYGDFIQDFVHPGIKQQMDKVVLPELLKARSWALSKLFGPDMAQMEKDYHDDFIRI